MQVLEALAPQIGRGPGPSYDNRLLDADLLLKKLLDAATDAAAVKAPDIYFNAIVAT